MAEAETARTIMKLIQAIDQLIGNFLSDPAAALKPVISQLQAEAGFSPVLRGALQEFGWQGSCFGGGIDLRALSSRLRAMLYSGLEQKGQGSFSVVFKVALFLPNLAALPPFPHDDLREETPLCGTRNLSSELRIRMPFMLLLAGFPPRYACTKVAG